MRHANRMFNSGDQILTKSDLVTLQAEDIRIVVYFLNLVTKKLLTCTENTRYT